MSEYVFIHIKTLDIFIIDIDHLNMDLESVSLHRQPDSMSAWFLQHPLFFV